MHFILTKDAKLVCRHEHGKVNVSASQGFVTINGRSILRDSDPVGKTISGCPNVGATIKPCTATLKVIKGYSGFIRIEGKKICLDTITGITDGTPPGMVEYIVRNPGQVLVRAEK
jgi:hypothetical protein